MTKKRKPKRHLVRSGRWHGIPMTYCGRTVSSALEAVDPDQRRATDCYWCRVTLEAEERSKSGAQ